MISRPDENLDETFESLFEVLRSDRFLERRGLGNELPFFISAFHATLQSKVDVLVPALVKRLSNQGIAVLHLDLYDLTIELLQSRGLWERLVEKEPTEPRDRFLQTIQNLSDPEKHLIPLIASKLEAHPCRVLLITGAGLVFPYVRSHSVLENLQKIVKSIPAVLFFPGDYTFVEGKGSHLTLFGILPNDRYYRAFNISDFRT